MNFSSSIEAIKKLSTEETEELQVLLKHYLIEERREQIFESYQLSLAEDETDKLKFSANFDDLRQILAEG